jgi:long-chain fatty acid transport protein
MIIMGIGLGFVNDAFGLGFGVNSSFGGSGRILLEDVDVSTDAQKPKQQNMMDLKLDMSGWVAGVYVDWGRIAAPLTGLSLGFSYRNESRFEIDPFDTATIVRVGGIPLDLELSLFDYYQPSSYVAGISYEVSGVLLAVDVEYQTWSDYKVSSNQVQHYSDVLPKLKDIWIPRIGCRFKVIPEMALLLGYYYQPSFVPNEATTGEVNWLDNDKHAASVGLSFDTGLWAGFQKGMVLHIAYQLQYLVKRDVTKSDPTSLNPNYSYGGMVHTAMLGISFL